MKQKDVITGWLVAFIISCMMLAGCTEKSRKLEKKNVKVETISVGNTNLGGTKDYVGTIEEKMGSTLSFEIAGNITSIRVEEGDRVSKGQLLATINPTTVKGSQVHVLGSGDTCKRSCEGRVGELLAGDAFSRLCLFQFAFYLHPFHIRDGSRLVQGQESSVGILRLF